MIERKCVQCGRTFTIEDSEIEFYNSKNLSLPKRCKECRDKNKKSNGKNRGNQVNIHNTKNDYDEKQPAKKNYEVSNANENKSNNYNSSGSQNGGNHNRKKNNIFKLLILAAVVIFGLFEGYGVYEKHNSSNSNVPSIENSSENSSSKNNGKGQDAGSSENTYTFRTAKDCTEHFKKHGQEFGYETEKQYVEGANKVINSSASLHKLEKEDGDDVYYLKDTNEFVIVSTSGFIRTYFKPQDGIAYFNRQ